MTDRPWKGGCFCGAVRYESAGAVGHASLCHCATCRRTSGAHVVAWVTVPHASFAFVAGAPRELASSPPVRRTFCGECGTSLTYRHSDDPDTIDIAIATLDDAAAIAPDEHLWMQEALPWDRPADRLPKFRTSRSAGERLEPL